MDTVLHALNQIVTLLNTINPAWYVVVMGPVVYFTQKALKAEEGFVHQHGLLAAILLALGTSAFLAFMQSANIQQFLQYVATTAPAIFTIANVLYQHVKAEIAAEAQAQLLAPAQTTTEPAPTPAPTGV